MATGIIWDQRYLEHITGDFHPERPERLDAIHKKLQEASFASQLQHLQPRLASEEEVSLVHSLDYVRQIEKTKGLSLSLDPDTHASPKSYETALLAVGGLLVSVDQVMQGALANSFAFVRPPGHHAEKERAMGFCLFNNVAIAAEYARKHYGVERVFIMDFDVHHGNGTQWAFYDRPDIFYCSTHRYPFYPGTGSETETGEGKGRGYTRNIIFSGGEGDLEYDTVFEKEVLPLIKTYQPGLILVSAGYDAHSRDPLGGMNVSSAGFAHMMDGLLKVADEVSEGRLVSVLEGGYDLEGLSESVVFCLERMIVSRE
jgi:acetoin utilization deacetylase AcuC-like enzyme